MISGIEGILLSSEDARKLAEFYEKKVGLKLVMEAEMGENTDLFSFEIKDGCEFYIIDHSDIKGKNPQPPRMMINFEVDDIEGEVKKLEDAGVKKVQEIYHIENYGLVATFEDLDGNYFQLVQIKPLE